MFTTTSGIKRSVYGQTGNFQFGTNLIIDTLFGGLNIGVSGEGANGSSIKINTFCNSGKIFDNSGRFISAYYPNKEFNISGNVIKNRYDLFINGAAISFGTFHPTGTFNYFYLQPTGVTCQYNFLLNGETPNLSISNISFETGAIAGTGYITNNSRLSVKIFAGEFTNFSNNSNLSLSGIFTGILPGLSSGAYYIIPGGSESLGNYNGNLRLYTNGGVIDYSNLISVTGSEPARIPVFNLNGLSTIYDGQNRSYTSDIQFMFEGGVPMTVSLSHISGSGDYYTNIDVVSGYSGNIYGYISNTGILAQIFTGIGTGQGGQLNNIGTGFSSGYVSGVFTYARGGFVWPYSIPVTGHGTGLSYTGMGTGFYNGHYTGYIIGDSGTYLVMESGAPCVRSVSSLLNFYATGFVHGSGQIYYNTPTALDKLYIRSNQNAIVNNFHYTDRASLVSYINSNTGTHWVTAAESGINAITISGIRGTETDIDISVDTTNAGNMTVSGPRLYGGVDIGIGAINILTLDVVTGCLNHVFTGSGYYTSTGEGYVYGSGSIIDYTKTFTGTWNLLTGESFSQVNYYNSQFYNTEQDKYQNDYPINYINSSALINVIYSNQWDSFRDVARLTISGSGYNTGLFIDITGGF